MGTIHPYIPYIVPKLTRFDKLPTLVSWAKWNLREPMGTIHLYIPYIAPKLTRFDKLLTFEIHNLCDLSVCVCKSPFQRHFLEPPDLPVTPLGVVTS
jgi:hypothetical protein